MTNRIALLLLSASLSTGCGSDSAAPTEKKPREAVRIVNAQGDQQTSYPGMPMPMPMVVTVTDISGSGVPDVLVRFVPFGGGWITDTEVLTDAQGRAATTWYLGPTVGGDNFLTAFSPVGTTGFRGYSTTMTAGEKYVSGTGLIEYTMGDVPLVLTASHGGALEPAEIPVRTSSNMSRDVGTNELVQAMSDHMRAHGSVPYSIVVNLHRNRMDADVAYIDATQANRLAEMVWREFHGLMAATRQYIQTRHERGLLVDVHGHAAPVVELGYLLSSAELLQTDQALNDPFFVNRTSIRALAQDNQSTLSYILRGGGSLGAMLAQAGVATSPSPAQPVPGAGYVAGGAVVSAYGSRTSGHLSAVYLQVPPALRTDAPARDAFAEVLVESLNGYFQSFYRGNSLLTR